MTGLHDQPDNAATPLSPEERDGLIPSHIALRRELNELEQQNILDAIAWAFDRHRPLTTEAFATGLHKRMYGQVWKWAGTYRTTEKNIGVLPYLIRPRLHETFEQFSYWIDNGTFPPDEIAVRYHHVLVAIHPFPNGNGRWSRLMGDLVAVQHGSERLSWGRGDLRKSSDVRTVYIDALRAADNHDLGPLLAFAKS
jgi:Fic-DOC domain mobile mystery protein B